MSLDIRYLENGDIVAQTFLSVHEKGRAAIAERAV